MVASVPRPRAVNSNPLQILSSRLLCSGKYSSNDGYNTQHNRHSENAAYCCNLPQEIPRHDSPQKSLKTLDSNNTQRHGKTAIQ